MNQISLTQVGRGVTTHMLLLIARVTFLKAQPTVLVCSPKYQTSGDPLRKVPLPPEQGTCFRYSSFFPRVSFFVAESYCIRVRGVRANP